MKAVFYDRKNKKIVSSNELKKINLIQYYAVSSERYMADSTEINNIGELSLKEESLGEFGYKSKNCPKYANWDLYTTLNDLVFLRLE